MRDSMTATILAVAAGLLVVGCGADEDAGAGGIADATAADASGAADTSSEGDVSDVADDVAGDPADAAGVDSKSPTDVSGDEDAPNGDAADDAGGEEVSGDSGDAADGSEDADETADAGPPPGCPTPCPITSKCIDEECVKQPTACAGGCDDDEFCNGLGVCQETSCTLPASFSEITQKTDSLVLPDGEVGCDLTGDGDVDNQLGVVLKVMANANYELKLRIDKGAFAMLFDAPGWNAEGTPFTLSGMPGELIGTDADCAPVDPVADCDYAAWDSGFANGPDGTCAAQFQIEVAVTNGVMKSLGEQTTSLTMPILPGEPLTFEVLRTRFEGKVVGEQTWEATTESLICGAVPLSTLHQIIDDMPQELYDDIGLSKEQAKVIAEAALDIDTNEDGFPDSLSAAAQLTTIPGSILDVF